ncbi:MAG: type II toxin-antitoxin system HicA family toxin [bacterium]|nr:type II toxin-antitoxin system HicA family toxin [bacterium]
MPKLPILSGRELIKILYKIGYHETRQRGSHIRLAAFERKSVTIPNYKEIDRSLLVKILRDARLSAEEFLKLVSEK